MKILRYWVVALMCVILVACGGGGGSPGTRSTDGGSSGGGGGSTTDPSTCTTDCSPPVETKIASFIYQLSKPTLSTSGSDATLVTVTALDANNNPVGGIPLSVSVDSGVYTPVSATTDAKGQASGNVTIGASKANRNITATISLGGQTAKAVIPVTGSQLSLLPVPGTPAPGTQVRTDIKVVDANGVGVPSVPVQLSGSMGFTGTVTTDMNGNASATLGAAPATPGTYTIDAVALGAKVSRSVQVIATGGGGIPVVTDTISSASLSIVPNTIAPNSTGSTTNRAALKAKFLNTSNQAVQNVRVRFEIVPPALGSGEQISTGTSTVYTDINGEAISDYIAGSRSSPTNGVTIRACYGADDASIADGACVNFRTATLTVASQPVSITLGDNNLLSKGAESLTYIKKFDVAVADSAGNAVPNAVVSASVDITHYGKGSFWNTDADPDVISAYQIMGVAPPNTSTTVLSEVGNMTAAPTAATRVWCPIEDLNRNGSLDLDEDQTVIIAPRNAPTGNGNGTLESRKADVILSYVGSNVTNASGRMIIQVEYPQNVATWLAYTVKVTTNVAGSEGTDSKSYITAYVVGDETNGSFLTAPYGSGNCVSSN